MAVCVGVLLSYGLLFEVYRIVTMLPGKSCHQLDKQVGKAIITVSFIYSQ